MRFVAGFELTGAILAKVDLCAAMPSACNGTVANGLSAVAVVNSYGRARLRQTWP